MAFSSINKDMIFMLLRTNQKLAMSFDVSKCLIIKVNHAHVEKRSSSVLPLTFAAVKSNSKIALALNSKGLFLAHTAYLSQVVWGLALKHVFSFRNLG